MIEIKEDEILNSELFKEVSKFLKSKGYSNGEKIYDLGRNWKGKKISDNHAIQTLDDVYLYHKVEYRDPRDLKSGISFFKWSFSVQQSILNGPLLIMDRAPEELIDQFYKVQEFLSRNLFNKYKIKFTTPSYRKNTYLEIYYITFLPSLLFNNENVDREIYQFINTLEKLIPRIRGIFQPPKQKGRF